MFVQMIKLNCYSDKSTTFYNTQAITDCKFYIIMSFCLLQPVYVPKLVANLMISLKVGNAYVNKVKSWS